MTRSIKEIQEKMVNDSLYGEQVGVSRGQWGAVIGALGRYLGRADHRYLICAYLFDDLSRPIHSKDLTDGQKFALFQWCGFYQDEQGEWRASLSFEVEVMLVFNAAVHEWHDLPYSERQKIGLKVDPLLFDLVGDLGGEAIASAWAGGQSSLPAIQEVRDVIFGDPRKLYDNPADDEPLEW